jgi:hypothetical protein
MRVDTIRGFSSSLIAFVDFEIVQQGLLCRIAQRLVHAGKIDEFAFATREFDVHHRLQRQPHQHVQGLRLRLDEGLHGHVAGNVVRECRPKQKD